MFSHIMIGARDLDTMVAFYDAVLAPLDLRRVVELDDVDEAGVV
jgi:catechol 2,3-dioxygenase-like lactoylglutathione lyase family enzyme